MRETVLKVLYCYFVATNVVTVYIRMSGHWAQCSKAD